VVEGALFPAVLLFEVRDLIIGVDLLVGDVGLMPLVGGLDVDTCVLLLILSLISGLLLWILQALSLGSGHKHRSERGARFFLFLWRTLILRVLGCSPLHLSLFALGE
jgi:hypothetical protein